MPQDRKTTELWVGVMVVAGLLILVLGIIWGKNYNLSTNQYRLKFSFPNTGGLRTNDLVSVNGVRKGSVTGIALEKGQAVIDVALSRDVELYTDYRATIAPIEMMGGKKIEIMPGSKGERIFPEDLTAPLPGTTSGGMSEALVGVTELATEVLHLTKRVDTTLTLVHRMLDENTVRQPIVRTLADLQATTAALHDLVASNELIVRRTLSNIDYTTGELREVVEQRRAALDSTLLSFNRTMQRLDNFSVVLDDISTRLSNREGNLGRLIYDDEIAAHLRSTLVNVDSTTTELRKNLGRFLSSSNFSLINVLSF
jgi:phospholipid/cholesterol/gamma-HCH transport system substrate-binding protein